MARPSPAVLQFMETYKVEADEIWEVHGSTWVVKHKALERVAAEKGIAFDEPKYLPDSDVKQGFATILVFARMGERRDWAFGEASPKNNRNAYPIAMASKRARDRVILQLLNVQGALYSEIEADEFERPQAEEEVIKRVDGIEVLTVDAQRKIFEELQKEVPTNATVEECKRWKVTARSRASRLSENWRKTLDGIYLKHLRELEQQDADEYIERMTG